MHETTPRGLIRRLFSRRPDKPVIAVHDIMVGAPPGISTKGARLPRNRQKPTIMSYEGRQSYRAGFVEPEYDLAEVGRALDSESYLRLSFDKHEELILKNRWSIVCQNDAVREHVLRRISEIGWSQNEPFERIVEAGIEDLVETSNVFYVLARRETGPKYQSRFGRNMYPITGIFSPNSSTMRPFVRTNKRGAKYISQWQQVMGGRLFKKYSPENVVHMAFRKKKGNIFGTPFCIPVLDDIIGLRRLEELVEILVNKHAFPFFHYRVGTEQEDAREYDDGHSEVDDVRAEIQSMPFEGGLVTPHRHEIIVLGTKNKAVNAEPYVKYYEARVLSGLNLSGIDIGRGETANRSTAQTMSKGLSDRCTRFQSFFSIWFSFFILDELVMEMGVVPTPENRAYLLFPTIDMEESRAKENHALTLFQGHLITEPEARVEINRDPIKDDQRKDMYFDRVAKPLALIQAVDEESGLGSPKAVATREQPENKSKRLTSKPTVAANAAMVVRRLWDDMRGNLLSDLDGVPAFFHKMSSDLAPLASSWLKDGFDRYRKEHAPEKNLYVGTNVEKAFVEDILEPRIDAVHIKVGDIMGSMQSGIDRAVMADSLWPLVERLVRLLPRMAESYGFARAAQLDRHKLVRWKLADEACTACKEKGVEPMPIHRFGAYDLQHHEECVVCLEVCPSNKV